MQIGQDEDGQVRQMEEHERVEIDPLFFNGRRTSMSEHIIDRLLLSIENGRYDDLYEFFSDDIIVWHNFDRLESDRDASVAAHHAFGKNVTRWKYTGKRRIDYEGGFVEQHIAHFTFLDGSEVSLPVCMVCSLKDGRISRIDEYFDPAPIASVMRKTPA